MNLTFCSVIIVSQLALTFFLMRCVSFLTLKKEVTDLQTSIITELTETLKKSGSIVEFFKSDNKLNYNSLLSKLNTMHMDIISSKTSTKKIESSIPAANRRPRNEIQREKLRQIKKEWWAKKRAADKAALDKVNLG